MTIKKLVILIPVFLLLINCNSAPDFIDIEFENHYKFNQEIEEDLIVDTLAWKHQKSSAEYSNKGEYIKALQEWDLAFPPRSTFFSKKQIDSITAEYDKVSAKNYIVKESKNHQVIIINEAHHNSAHRAFTTTLLHDLYNQGYKNLGLEALGNGKDLDSSLNKRGYPIQESGYYTKDPQFGNLIRTALKIGYTLFPYEHTGQFDGKQREIGQAKNIKKFIDQNPNEKYLIHCGFGHVMEGNVAHWEKAMAGRLQELTGIDPFTINQTRYSEKSDSTFNDPMLKALNLKEPSILIDKNNNPKKYIRDESYTDIAVFHPNTDYQNARPQWKFEPDKKTVKIELKNLNISFPVMVLAYLKNEDIKTAIPLDIIEVQNSEKVGHLALRKGDYNIVITNPNREAVQFQKRVR